MTSGYANGLCRMGIPEVSDEKKMSKNDTIYTVVLSVIMVIIGFEINFSRRENDPWRIRESNSCYRRERPAS